MFGLTFGDIFRPKMMEKVQFFFFFWRCYCSDKFFGQKFGAPPNGFELIRSCHLPRRSFMFIELMRDRFFELFDLSHLLQMVRHGWNADTKLRWHFPHTLSWVLLDNRSQMFEALFPQNFWNHLRTALSLVVLSPYASLMFAVVWAALLPSLNSCKKSNHKSSFFILKMHGFIAYKMSY